MTYKIEFLLYSKIKLQQQFLTAVLFLNLNFAAVYTTKGAVSASTTDDHRLSSSYFYFIDKDCQCQGW